MAVKTLVWYTLHVCNCMQAIYNIFYDIITSAKEVMFLPVSICLSVH